MAMRVINVKQGTPEWHQHRANTFNASDAPAMMGCSKYKSRAELLREMATGEIAPVDEATQKRFDDGHRFEALARGLAEMRIGDDLFPITGANDSYGLARSLGASFDGLVMGEDVAFEHKSMNAEIRAIESAVQLPLMYRVQMEQQMMVCPGLERIMFMASKWNDKGECIESKEFWYESDPALRVQILEGWKRFSEDLEAAKATGIKADVPKGVAAAIDSLPALSIQLKGEIIATNLPAFQKASNAFIAAINTDLKTDDDFATAKAQVGYLKEVEERIEATLEAALAQAASIDEMRRAVMDTKGRIAEIRLKLDRTVKTREAEIKAEIQRGGMEKFNARVEQLKPLFQEIRPIIPAPDFAAAIKNKRTIASLNNAVEGELNRALGVASEIAAKVNANLQHYSREAFGFETLFPDLQSVIYKDSEDLIALIRTRIANHKAKEEAKTKPVEPAPAVAPAASPRQASPAPAPSIMPAAELKDATRPSRMDIVNLVAERWGVSISVARDWLRAEFGGE